jgi:hypothetical protein
MTDQINQQSKPDPKWSAVTSLVFGIISAINGVGVFYIPILTGGFDKPFPSLVVKYIYAYGEIKTFTMVTLLISVLGLILGIKVLKSTKKVLGIIGIILCLGGSLGIILIYSFMNLMALGM